MIKNLKKIFSVLPFMAIFLFLMPSFSFAETNSSTQTNISADTTNFKSGDVFEHNGRKYVFNGNDEAYSDGDMKGCEILPNKIYKMSKCLVCPLVKTVLSTADTVTTNAFSKFAGSFRVLIAMVFALWIALLALKQVFTFTKQDAPKFLNALIKQSFKFLIAFLLLSSPSMIYDKFILPVLSSGMELGKTIQSAEMNIDQNKTQKNNDTGGGYFTSKRSGQSFYDRIESGLISVQLELARMQAIGSTLVCVGWNHTPLLLTKRKLDDFKNGLMSVFVGFIMFFLSLFISLAFGFYILDAFIQMIIVGAMMPLMIAGWPFKITSSYASTGLKVILNSFFILFFLGFVISVCVQLVSQVFVMSNNNQDALTDGLNYIETLINDQNVPALMKYVNVGTNGLLLLIFASFFGFKFIGEATSLASSISGGGMAGGIGSSFATTGASFIKGVAKKTTSPIRNVVSEKLHEKGGFIGITTGAVARHAEKHEAKLQEKITAGEAAGKKMRLTKFRANFTRAVSKSNRFVQSTSKKVHALYQDSKK